MNLRQRIGAWISGEQRSSLENPQTPLTYPAEWLLDIFNGGRTDSGMRVSQMTALQVSDVYACVDLISSAIASQPVKIFERIEAGETMKRHAKRLATEHALFDLLRYRPNEEMTAFTWKKALFCHALLWGNHYSYVERMGSGQAAAIWPLDPSKTRPYRRIDNGELVFRTTAGLGSMAPGWEEDKDAVTKEFRKEDVLFIPGLSLDGRIGQDTIWLARQLMGLTLASEKYAAKYFGNGASPGGVLTIPGMLTKEKKDQMLKAWKEAHGAENRHGAALLEGGVSFQKIGSTPSEAQMVDARRLARGQVASLFHVPLTMLGETGAAKANAEQVALEFVNYTLAPWVTRLEEELKVKLFEPAKVGRSAGKTFLAVIDTRRLTLPDSQSKQQFYGSGRQWTYLRPNDILEMEDLNPIPGPLGESYLVPVNMVPVDDNGQPISFIPSSEVDQKPQLQPGAGKVASPPAAQDAEPEGDEGTKPVAPSDQDQDEQARALYLRIWEDAFRRDVARDRRTAERTAQSFAPLIKSICEFMGTSERYEQIMEEFKGRSMIWSNVLVDEQARDEFDELLKLARNS